MSESISITTENREDKYIEILPQIYSVVSTETNLFANCANITAMLKEVFGFFWIGFYFADTENELVLGPFQGTLACTRIRKGKGVCGDVFAKGELILVDDVDKYPGHIACSSSSQSEIVIPIEKNGIVVAVLDIDSDKQSDFNDIDAKYLSEMCIKLSEIIF